MRTNIFVVVLFVLGGSLLPLQASGLKSIDVDVLRANSIEVSGNITLRSRVRGGNTTTVVEITGKAISIWSEPNGKPGMGNAKNVLHLSHLGIQQLSDIQIKPDGTQSKDYLWLTAGRLDMVGRVRGSISLSLVADGAKLSLMDDEGRERVRASSSERDGVGVLVGSDEESGPKSKLTPDGLEVESK